MNSLYKMSREFSRQRNGGSGTLQAEGTVHSKTHIYEAACSPGSEERQCLHVKGGGEVGSWERKQLRDCYKGSL